jgi:hypothetical protein
VENFRVIKGVEEGKQNAMLDWTDYLCDSDIKIYHGK